MFQTGLDIHFSSQIREILESCMNDFFLGGGEIECGSSPGVLTGSDGHTLCKPAVREQKMKISIAGVENNLRHQINFVI